MLHISACKCIAIPSIMELHHPYVINHGVLFDYFLGELNDGLQVWQLVSNLGGEDDVMVM